LFATFRFPAQSTPADGAAPPDAPSMFREGRPLFEALSRQMPLLLVREDLHRADETSVDLLSFATPSRPASTCSPPARGRCSPRPVSSASSFHC
jgi:hypothetical protein